MAKISMSQAAKMFSASRPTLSKALKDGKISGEKTDGGWLLDTSELARVYDPRVKPDDKLQAYFTERDVNKTDNLQAEIKLLQAKLEAAEKLLEERGKHLDDLRRLLPGPQDMAPRRRWWPF